jgi:hypothetical protein
MACFSLSEGSKARPLTLPVAAWSDLLESARSRQPGPLPPRFRQDARLFTTQSAFHQQVPLGPCLRRTQRNPPPFSRSCRLRAGFRRSTSPFIERPSVPRLRGSPSFVRQKAALPAARSFRPGRSADRMHRLSTSAIATILEHDSGLTATPQALPEVAPLHRFYAGSVASFDASLAELSQVQGPTCALQRRQRLPAHEAWELCPDLEKPGHLMSRTRVHAGRRSQAQSLWDIVPTSSPADSARPSAQGLHFPTFREEDQNLRTRGAFPSWAAPKGWLGDSTNCHQPVE